MSLFSKSDTKRALCFKFTEHAPEMLNKQMLEVEAEVATDAIFKRPNRTLY